MELQKGYLYNSSTRLRRARQLKIRRISLVVVIVIFIAILVVILFSYFSHKVEEYEGLIEEETQKIEVDVEGGRVRGIYEGKSVAFKGIPFAEPMFSAKRWTSPVPCSINKCWNGTFSASEFGSSCVQRDIFNEEHPTAVIGSEDCLFINVWTPRKRPNANMLPVLVYIHGGFLLYSSGNAGGLHPSPQLISDMNVIGVSFNYRLNAFGFLALKSLADSSPSKTSGNYGFMDQILALKWVKANIGKFGGNPQSVTLIGQRSGATSELALLSSPQVAGLFQRAILMSGSPVFNKTWEAAAFDNQIFVKRAKCVRNTSAAERECLFALSPEEIQDAIPWNVYPYWGMTDQADLPTKNLFDGAVAVVDKHVVPSPPLIAMTTGQANDVPIIVGTMAQEIALNSVKHFGNSTWDAYSSYVKEKLFPFIGKNVKKVLVMYNKSLPDGSSPSPQFSYTSMGSDIRMTCPNNLLALNASRGFKNQVYRYVVTNAPSKPVNCFGSPTTLAFHLWDLIALFGFPKEVTGNYSPSEKDVNFMKDLRQQFGRFIHNEDLKAWKKYPQHTALFTDNGMKILDQDGYHKEECDFWLDNGFFSYAWIN